MIAKDLVEGVLKDINPKLKQEDIDQVYKYYQNSENLQEECKNLKKHQEYWDFIFIRDHLAPAVEMLPTYRNSFGLDVKLNGNNGSISIVDIKPNTLVYQGKVKVIFSKYKGMLYLVDGKQWFKPKSKILLVTNEYPKTFVTNPHEEFNNAYFIIKPNKRDREKYNFEKFVELKDKVKEDKDFKALLEAKMEVLR